MKYTIERIAMGDVTAEYNNARKQGELQHMLILIMISLRNKAY